MSDIVDRLRDAQLNHDKFRFGWLAEASDEIERLRARIAELEQEASMLAANQCHNGYGDEGGHHRCEYQDRVAELETAIDGLGKQIADCWRVRMKDRVEIDQLRVAELEATKIDRANLRRLCEAATPGPWSPTIGEQYTGISMVCDYADGRGPYRVVADCGTDRTIAQNEANAALIAAARTALPALLDALDAAEARERKLREALAIYIHAHASGNSVSPHVETTARGAIAETAP